MLFLSSKFLSCKTSTQLEEVFVYSLPVLPYLKQRFVLEAQQDAFLPQHKGSMLRGAFGHALKSTVCVMRKSHTCETCMLRQQCVYTRIFETFIDGPAPPFLRGLNTSPRPFLFHVPDMNQTYKKGDNLEFELTLFGRACELHPYVIFAMSRAAEKGFTVHRVPFKLKSVHFQILSDNIHSRFTWQQLYDGSSQCLCATATALLTAPNGSLASPTTLRFLTPTRLKVNKKLTKEFNFRTLVFKMLRRVLEMAFFHVPDSHPDWDFHDFLCSADDVKITHANLNWDDWHRYSNRQKSQMEMGGFTGDITLDGDLSRFSHLLKTSEVLHVGKGTVFGLGRVVVG